APGRAPGESDAAEAPGATPPPSDGSPLAATFARHGSLTIATDVLGLFPVYHGSAGGTVLAASHLPLLRAHESFRPALDPAGLIGLLLTRGLVEGRALYPGVRRLASGHAPSARPGREPRGGRPFRGAG